MYDLHEPEWVLDLLSDDFMKASGKPIYSSPLPFSSRRNPNKEKSLLAPATPEPIRAVYELGLRVREISNDLYALQLRKALEGVCQELGAAQFRSNGQRISLYDQIRELYDQIRELKDKNLLGSYIGDAAQDLRDVSNTGAHFSEERVSADDIRKLEKVFGLITEYAYHPKTKPPVQNL
jgi:Domain of unknown function (DUF4145)